MKVWRQEWYADLGLRLACLTVHACANSQDQASAAIAAELESIDVHLYPGPMWQTSDAMGVFQTSIKVVMTRYIPSI